MFDRFIAARVEQAFTYQPAVVLVGPRQVGKTTLARQIAARYPEAVFIDLETEAGRLRLRDPAQALEQLRGRLVVIDEVQQSPDLFRVLRPEIDADRRSGRFLLLGSATGDLLRQSGESLAGRVAYVELSPLTLQEVSTPDDTDLVRRLWWRGGFPRSWSAPTELASVQWRSDYIEALVHRDLPAMGVKVPAAALRRFWGMLAHLQGQIFNATMLGQSLGGLSHSTVQRYLDLMVDALVVRRLPPFFANVGKRLVKSPKVYVRDSGLLHRLLNVEEALDLQVLPQAGASWEGFIIEQILATLPDLSDFGFYRTSAGAEIDLVLQRGLTRVGVEIKLSTAPQVTRGFWNALQDLGIERSFVVAPVQEGFPLGRGAEVLPPSQLHRIGEALRTRRDA